MTRDPLGSDALALPVLRGYEGPAGLSDEALHARARALGIAVSDGSSTPAGRLARMRHAAKESTRGRLPPRYATDTWHVPFAPRLADVLLPGSRILDVGAGARPMVAPDDRPDGVVYVGFDVDDAELRKAPPGSYDDIVVGDVCVRDPSLLGEFDLVLSWLTMEHVRPVRSALLNLASYQREGGRFLGYISGGRSLHAALNRFVPRTLGRRAMRRLLGREPDTVFRAYYDSCHDSALRAIADEAWRRAEVVPLHTGGWYLSFSPWLRAPYLAYEEWVYTGGHHDFASYYLVEGVR